MKSITYHVIPHPFSSSEVGQVGHKHRQNGRSGVPDLTAHAGRGVGSTRMTPDQDHPLLASVQEQQGIARLAIFCPALGVDVAVLMLREVAYAARLAAAINAATGRAPRDNPAGS